MNTQYLLSGDRKTIPHAILAIVLSCALLSCTGQKKPVFAAQKPEHQTVNAARPNILLITADDLGYTDLGVFGSEIKTPNLDTLAHAGVMLTNFHTAPSCSPTRSMLFSGTDNHLAGLGSMREKMEVSTPDLMQYPGYEGYLNFRVASLANLMRDAGYGTYMTGKWHLGMDYETGPAARGFDKSFAMMDGGGGHFNNMGLGTGPKQHKVTFHEDGKPTQLPKDFYSTQFYAEKMIDYLKHGKNDEKPFFAFLSFSAPHWPLQAPEKSIAKYRGRYDSGYERLFQQRLERQQSLGIVDEEVVGQPLLPGEPKWEDLTEQERRREARIMEIYAAMIDDLDAYVGRVIDTLKETGEYENTVIFFMSDNGAEGRKDSSIRAVVEWIEQCCDNSFDNMGKGDSYLFLGPNWARASVGPGSLYKGHATQGGIVSPAFMTYPNSGVSSRHYDGFLSVMDVLPTILEIAGTEHPGSRYKGREVLPVKGVSMKSLLDGSENDIHDENYVMGWELSGQQGIRRGDWKITLTLPPNGNGQWGLYNLEVDPTELDDLSQREPERLQKMLALWEQYVAENGVIPMGSR